MPRSYFNTAAVLTVARDPKRPEAHRSGLRQGSALIGASFADSQSSVFCVVDRISCS